MFLWGRERVFGNNCVNLKLVLTLETQKFAKNKVVLSTLHAL